MSEESPLDAERLERLFQVTPVPLFVLDVDRAIVHANHRARHTVGRSESSLMGTPFTELVDPSWRKGLDSRLAADAPPCTVETGLLTADGKTLYARVEAIPVDAEHLLLAVLVLTEDSRNLRLVGDTFDTTRDRVRALSADYDRG